MAISLILGGGCADSHPTPPAPGNSNIHKTSCTIIIVSRHFQVIPMFPGGVINFLSELHVNKRVRESDRLADDKLTQFHLFAHENFG